MNQKQWPINTNSVLPNDIGGNTPSLEAALKKPRIMVVTNSLLKANAEVIEYFKDQYSSPWIAVNILNHTEGIFVK